MKESLAPATLNLLNDKGSVDKSFDLAGKSTYYLGRGGNSDITLPYSWVSRKHAMIQAEKNGAHNAIDLGSSNGTFVNGKRIYTPTRLRSGDLVGVGRTVLVFLQENDQSFQQAPEEDAFEEKTVAFVNQEIVTVLICDIHDYTKLSETIGDSLVSKFLQKWSNTVTNLVNDNDGTVDKFIGDAVMAMWTGGSSIGNNIRQALQTVIEISEFTSELGRKMPEIPWELRIGAGLNTGEAVVGNIGGDGRRELTVIGDAVNVAFRLEGMTSQAAADVLMGGSVADYLPELVNYSKAGKYALKGKEERIQTYGCTFAQLRAYLGHTQK